MSLDNMAMGKFTPESRWVAAAHVVTSNLDGEAALLDESSGMYFGLDSVGATLWGYLQGSLSVGAMLAGLTEEYDVTEEVAAVDLHRFLANLEQHGLIRAVADGSHS